LGGSQGGERSGLLIRLKWILFPADFRDRVHGTLRQLVNGVGEWLTEDGRLVTAGKGKGHKCEISHRVRRFLALREIIYMKPRN